MLLCKYLISFHFPPEMQRPRLESWLIDAMSSCLCLMIGLPSRSECLLGAVERACCVRARDYFLLLLPAVSAIRFHVLLHYITRPVRRRERKENQRLDNYNGIIDFSLQRWSCKVHSRPRNNEAKINFNSTGNNPRSRTAGRRSVPREIWVSEIDLWP